MLTLSGSLILAVSPVVAPHAVAPQESLTALATTDASFPAPYANAISRHPTAQMVADEAPPSPPQSETERNGEIVIVGRKESPEDPLSAVNAESFELTQTFDEALVGPAAKTYKKVLPSPVRKGIRNFLYNLREPVVFLNFMLQLKPGKAVETVGRFAINSTIGAAGLVDVAKRKPFHLPRRSNGFANTLGYYGVGNGPFLFLPIVGPTTVRDLVGGTIDRLVLPTAVGSPFNSVAYTAPAGILGALDHRAEFDETLKSLHEKSPDRYAATRAFYLNRRQSEIDQLRGRKPENPTGMTGPPSSVQPYIPPHLHNQDALPTSPDVPEQVELVAP